LGTSSGENVGDAVPDDRWESPETMFWTPFLSFLSLIAKRAKAPKTTIDAKTKKIGIVFRFMLMDLSFEHEILCYVKVRLFV